VTVTIRRVIHLVAGAALIGASAAVAAPPPPAQIAEWVAALGAPQYSQREAATRGLIEAGPAALEPLRKAIDSGDLEVSTRAIEVARAMLGGEDAAVTTAAEAFLQSLAEGDDPSLAHMAESTLDFHALGRAEAARAELEALGAEFTRTFLPTGQPGPHVKLDSRWRGGSADLRLLSRVPELYGTGVTEAQVAALAEKLPETTIEVRKGGKLGVGGQPNPGPCLITQVQEDSAAEKAGVQVGDIVAAVDGQPVANFEALTDHVGERGPGEKVTLDIQRGPPGEDVERLSLTVELDAW
jgi:hypothetical protein